MFSRRISSFKEDNVSNKVRPEDIVIHHEKTCKMLKDPFLGGSSLITSVAYNGALLYGIVTLHKFSECNVV